MSRYTAQSDYDYADAVEGRTRSGIERTCTSCGRPVMVSRDEVYQLQVFCDWCIMKSQIAQPARSKGAV